MQLISRYIIDTAVLLSLFLVISCSKVSFPEEQTNEEITNNSSNTVNDSVKGTLVFHENFQKWAWQGYLVQSLQNCETDLMRSAETVSYLPTTISVAYGSLTVNYAVIDFAVNPGCGNPAGTSTDSSEVSNGYVALQCPIYYTCRHYSKGDLVTSPIPSVSYVEFTVSYSNSYAEGISLWKKADGDADTIKVGTYVPVNPLKGQKFTVKLNTKNVVLKFKAEKNSMVTIANESTVNRAVRIHDIYIWKPKE
ncbi:MAG: hypothetical protein Q8928_17000 [Bacteroidota bacterium]|nr:hypothetical protein [Bacteroidota bacterium]